MLSLLPLLILSFALSLDSCSVGFTYGLRNLRIPYKSIIVISICSAVVMIISMQIGIFIQAVFSPVVAQKIGGSVLVFIGSWILYQFFKRKKEETPLVHADIEKMIWNLEIKSLGVVIHILHKPTNADMDRSGTITGLEALLLGLALSLDAFGAGIGASMLGFSPLLLSLMVALMSSTFLFIGMKLGALLAQSEWLQRFSFIPGILLIIIGILKM